MEAKVVSPGRVAGGHFFVQMEWHFGVCFCSTKWASRLLLSSNRNRGRNAIPFEQKWRSKCHSIRTKSDTKCRKTFKKQRFLMNWRCCHSDKEWSETTFRFDQTFDQKYIFGEQDKRKNHRKQKHFAFFGPISVQMGRVYVHGKRTPFAHPFSLNPFSILKIGFPSPATLRASFLYV